MATDVTVRAVLARANRAELAEALERALGVFRDVEAACTRFDRTSPLMRANACPSEAHRVPPYCFDALREAYQCYRSTAGRFDPRVLTDLLALGYDRSLPFSSGDVRVSTSPTAGRHPLPRWRPRFWEAGHEVVLGGLPVDLGGIGKGLAVRWASQTLREVSPDHLIEAGGDCYCSGSAPDEQPWLVAVEDPFGGTAPRAVLSLRDLACATSSIRLRSWTNDGGRVHHIVDPRSGRPGGEGLWAVTVVTNDPAHAEVWSKVLFLTGRSGIADAAERRRLAALWVEEDGAVRTSTAMTPHLRWGPA